MLLKKHILVSLPAPHFLSVNGIPVIIEQPETIKLKKKTAMSGLKFISIFFLCS